MRVQVYAERKTIATGKPLHILLTIENKATYSLNEVQVAFHGSGFTVSQSPPFPNTLPPGTATTADYILQGQNRGTYNLVVVVTYQWDDPETGTPHRGVVTATTDEITVRNFWVTVGESLPGYALPLILGFLISLLTTLFNNWQQQRRQARDEERRVMGIILPILRSSRRAIQNKEVPDYEIWHEVVVKGGLYLALDRLGQAMKQPDLGPRLAELSVPLAEYTRRQRRKSLTEDFTTKLTGELTELITILESRLVQRR
ncbi:MAG TPA: hypothetical protein EYP49_10840 [Anaerolineae bacterium]|nr:hypothetical protein [Anaerolineae bacterium]